MLLSPQLSPVRVRVANLPISATTELGQVAGPRSILITPFDDGSYEVQLLAKVDRYELLPEGELGEVAGPGYAKAPDVPLLASASCAVDTDDVPRYRLITETRPASGRHPEAPGTALNLATREVETFAAGQDWRAYLDAKPELLVLQSVAFGIVAAHERITLFDLLQHYLELADAAPSRFA